MRQPTADNIAVAHDTRGDLPDGTGKQLILYSLIWSLALLAAVPFAAAYSGEGAHLFSGFCILLTSPSKLVTDYFNLGGLGASFLNAALCGLACNLMMLITRARPSANLLAGYFLVIAHCFYGLNFVNMWPPFFGAFVFCLVFRKPFGKLLHLAMFATSLGPFISDLLFRYTLGERFDPAHPQLTPLGVLLALLFGLGAGFIVPALLGGTTAMHRGFNLFKAGLAIGLFGMFAYALLYKTLGFPVPDVVVRDNPLYFDDGERYILFMNVFFVLIFAATLLLGFLGNKRSFRGYGEIWRCDGLNEDFPKMFGMPLTLINIGVYGLFILVYMNAIFFLTAGVGFSGPSVGATIAAITFASSGQTPRTVWPIMLGYTLFSLLIGGVCFAAGVPLLWSLSAQGYINGFAFATGLCPFSGRYGWKVGTIAGMLHAILCTSTAAMHGGFVLYNGGLTSGLTALLLIPILDFYAVKEKPSARK